LLGGGPDLLRGNFPGASAAAASAVDGVAGDEVLVDGVVALGSFLLVIAGCGTRVERYAPSVQGLDPTVSGSRRALLAAKSVSRTVSSACS
jgi:hypothetical protein